MSLVYYNMYFMCMAAYCICVASYVGGITCLVLTGNVYH